MNTIARETYLLKMQIAELTEKHNQLLTRLKIVANGETTTFGSYRLSFIIRQGSVDYSKIPQLANIDLNIYRKDDVTVSKLEFLGESNG